MNKIVIADRSNIIQHSLSLKLISAGYTIRVADSWEELNSFFEAEVVDLVIMDVGFPSWKSADAIRDMKRSHPNLLIIVIFKALTIPEIIELVREGADDCMPKPLDMALLVSRIRTLLISRDTDRSSVDRLLAEKRRERYRSEGSVIIPTEEIQHMINLAKDRDIPVLLNVI